MYSAISARPKAHHIPPQQTRIAPEVIGKTFAEVAAMEMARQTENARRGQAAMPVKRPRTGPRRVLDRTLERQADIIRIVRLRPMTREEIQGRLGLSKAIAKKLLSRMESSGSLRVAKHGVTNVYSIGADAPARGVSLGGAA